MTSYQLGMTKDGPPSAAQTLHSSHAAMLPQEYPPTDISCQTAATPTRSTRLNGGGVGSAVPSQPRRSSSGGAGPGGGGVGGGIAAATGFGSGLLAGATSMLTKVATHVSGADVDAGAGAAVEGAAPRARNQVESLKVQVLATTQENEALSAQVRMRSQGGGECLGGTERPGEDEEPGRGGVSGI